MNHFFGRMIAPASCVDQTRNMAQVLMLVAFMSFFTLVHGRHDNYCPTLKGCICKTPQSPIISCKNMQNITALIDALHSRYRTTYRLFISKTPISKIDLAMFSNLTIHEMFLFRCNITEVADHSISNIRDLIRLKLIGGTLKAIPKDITRLSNTLALSLSEHKLEKLESSDFQNLTQLIHLDLSRNSLAYIEESTFRGFSRLINLVLSSNNLSFIYPKTFSDMVMLSTVELADNKIKSLDGLFDHLDPVKFILDGNLLTNIKGVFNHMFIRVTEMDLSRNSFPSISSSALAFKFPRLVELNLKRTNLQHLEEDQFLGLKNIRRLHLNRNQLTQILPRVFEPMIGIEFIELSSNDLTHIMGLFKNFKSLTHLYLNRNKLLNITLGFEGLTKLQVLGLASNRLKHISKSELQNMPELTELYLSHNSLEALDDDVFEGVPKIQRLEIFYNKLVSLGRSLNGLTSIANIALDHNRLEHLDGDTFGESQSISRINLQRNQLRSVEMVFSKLSSLAVLDLSGNFLTTLSKSSFSFTHIQYLRLYENRWECDCRLNWLVDLIVDKKVHITKKTKCSKPERWRRLELMKLNRTILNSWQEDCPNKCRCHCVVNGLHVNVTTNCSNSGLQQLPKNIPEKTTNVDFSSNNISEADLRVFRNVRVANLSMNIIQNMADVKLGHSLQKLNLDDNLISEATEDVLEDFVRLQEIRLSNNSWKCGCDAIEFRNWLLRNTSKIADIRGVRCNNEKQNGNLYGKSIIKLGSFDLCPEQIIILVSLTVVLGIMLIAAVSKVVYNRYSVYIKMWLYSRQLCTCLLCIKPLEEVDDENKRFDAFISYTALDFKFVMEDIVNVLDNEYPQYNVCIHDRHFNPTRDIGDNIIEAIQCSKRIVLILTANFMNSNWCMYEFRTALLEALENRENRILLVVAGELPPMDELSPDIKMYLETTTYLKWTDANFWEKFIYVLPRVNRSYTAAERRSLLLQETGHEFNSEIQPLVEPV